MYGLLILTITLAAGFGGYLFARNFVRRRLRFVDAVRSPLAPVLAGLGAAVIAWPVAVLPIVTTTTALVFGLGTGLGTASGVKALGRGE